jgi:hypothetical protein
MVAIADPKLRDTAPCTTSVRGKQANRESPLPAKEHIAQFLVVNGSTIPRGIANFTTTECRKQEASNFTDCRGERRALAGEAMPSVTGPPIVAWWPFAVRLLNTHVLSAATRLHIGHISVEHALS